MCTGDSGKNHYQARKAFKAFGGRDNEVEHLMGSLAAT
jgi:hypothetical protein